MGKHTPEKLNIISIDYHRNGICGCPFTVAIFDEPDADGNARRMLAVVFDSDKGTGRGGDDGRCAVFQVDKLTSGDIAFGSNSWRGDRYENIIRKEAIKAFGE